MKIALLSVLLVVLHYHGAFSMESDKSSDEEGDWSMPTPKKVSLKEELRKVAIKVKNTLVEEGIVRGNEFGFLLLGNRDDNFSSLEFRTDGFLIFDNRRPDSNLYDNFLAALPYQDFTQASSSGEMGKWVHTEDSLLGELDVLYDKYLKRHTRQPDFILLYSYLMPCDGCTYKIIRKRNSPQYKTLRWFVAYTMGKSDKNSYTNNIRTVMNTKKLESKGITVLNV